LRDQTGMAEKQSPKPSPAPKPRPKPPRKMTKAEQSERFKETARKLGADETGEAFHKALKTVIVPKKRIANSTPG
jgi:hypothetical protein